MSEQKASRTALGVAYLRAAHQLLDAPPHILEDPVAVRLLGPGASKRIQDAAHEYRAPARLALRAHVVLRSRFAEDRLEAAALRGVTQYVLLGAGFDTFALRQPEWAQALRIVEVDQPASQAAKRAQIANAGIEVAENVSFASIDFERESLRDGLLRNGVSLHEPTFFSWLGVTMYLEETAIDAVLHTVAAFPSGSEIVLTFTRPPDDAPSPVRDHAANVGERWISHFEPENLEAKLRGCGFDLVEFLSKAEAKERYFRNAAGTLPVPRRINIVAARV